MLYFWVSEEFGYADYLWAFPGTPEEAIAVWIKWRDARINKPLQGEWLRVSIDWKTEIELTPHCRGDFRKFCDECARIEITRYSRRGDATIMTEITDVRRLAGRGHVHESEDTYLDVTAAGQVVTVHDLHLRCQLGCVTCGGCGGHASEPKECRVCTASLCAECAPSHPFCARHSIVDAVASFDDSGV